MLFFLAVAMAYDYHGCGTFATVYDDVVVVLPIAHPSRGVRRREPGTYRMIYGHRRPGMGAGVRNGCRRLEHLADGLERVSLHPGIISYSTGLYSRAQSRLSRLLSIWKTRHSFCLATSIARLRSSSCMSIPR